MNRFLKLLESGKTLTEAQMMDVIRLIMDARASNEELAPFLTTLSKRGETAEEITAVAKVMREKSMTIKSPPGTVDCCGTGGDKSGSYNISTAVAFVVAGCGVPVAKHGNRASSSKCGAADILEYLGINLNMPFPALEESLKRFNFAFLLASRHHPAMRHVAIVRKKLGVPTIFNLVGPLTNPAGAKRQLVGVFDRKWLVPMATALKNLGSEKAWVVHGHDGLDEITITGKTYAAVLENGKITEKVIRPEDFGIETQEPAQLKGGDAKINATALRALLEGKKDSYRLIVQVNAAALLHINGAVDSLPEGMKRVTQSLDKGLALQVMKDYLAFSREDQNMAEQA